MEKEHNKYNIISEILKDPSRNENLLSALESFITAYKEEISNNKPKIPITIFSNKNLGILEAVTKYLRENLSLRYSQIAKILTRDDRTIWVTYKNALNKKKDRFEIEDNKQTIPCDIFSNRKIGPLESLVIYLKDNLHLNFHEISEKLGRDYHTIYVSYNNGKKK